MLLRPAGYATASNRTAGREIGAGVAALLRRARKTDKDASEAPKSAKWKIRIAPELRSTSTRQRHGSLNAPLGSPDEVCNLIRAKCKI